MDKLGEWLRARVPLTVLLILAACFCKNLVRGLDKLREG
jgi:hypothetical protein